MNVQARVRIAQLGDVATIERSGVAPNEIEAGTSYLGLEHIASGGDIIEAARVDPGDLASTKFSFSSEHLLFGKLRPYLAKIALPDFHGVCSTDIVPIRPGSHLDRRYLAYFLRQPRMVEFVASRATGVNLPRISPKALAEIEIPLPPLEEQKRIAAILDQADALRRLRRRALDRLNALGQSIFHEMFGDPKIDVDRWPTVDFAEACRDETSRSAKVQRGDYLEHGEIPIVDQGQSDVAGFSDDPEAVCRSELPIVLFGDHTRKVKFIDFPFAIGADGAKVLKPSDRFDALFFSFLLAAMPIPDLGYSRHMREVKRLAFPAPPRELQETLAARISQIMEHRERTTRAEAAQELLFSTLQARAFSGEA